MGSLIDQHNALSHSHSSAANSAPPLFTEGQIKRLVLQLLSGVEYMHSHFTMHRDLKLSNLLLSASGLVKIADFGLARVFSNPLDQYTPKVVTLWYRAPELLLGSSSSYHSAIDIWSVGCIVAELLLGRPLFPGQTELEQLELICRLLGTPNDKIWPSFQQYNTNQMQLPHYPYNRLHDTFGTSGREAVALIGRMLTYDPSKRITADKAARHAWFSEQPLPVSEERMPRWGDERVGGASGGRRTREREESESEMKGDRRRGDERRMDEDDEAG